MRPLATTNAATCYASCQAKLQQDVAAWVAEHVDSGSAERTECSGGVIRDTLEFVKLLERATYELTPADHPVVGFLRQLGINCYDIAARKIDFEVIPTTLLLSLQVLHLP